MKRQETKRKLLTQNDIDKIRKEAFYNNQEFKIIEQEFKRLAKI